MVIRQASPRSLRDCVRIWLATLGRPQNFQRALLRICGTLDLSITLIPLVWLLASWYPLDRVARDTMPVLIAVMLTVAAGVALWVVPWERLPPAAILPVLVVGTIDTTILVGYTHRQSSFLLYFLWVGFGAIFLPRDLGV